MVESSYIEIPFAACWTTAKGAGNQCLIQAPVACEGLDFDGRLKLFLLKLREGWR